MKILLLILIMSSISLFAQQENNRWTKAVISYVKESIPRREYAFRSETASGIAAEAFTKAYWILISDLDGDNCPFRPSCSEFFSEAVSKTNIFTGTLLFFDRFTRDLNFINRPNRYEILPDGHFYDPPEKYFF